MAIMRNCEVGTTQALLRCTVKLLRGGIVQGVPYTTTISGLVLPHLSSNHS
jgi:hypothetical protein